MATIDFKKTFAEKAASGEELTPEELAELRKRLDEETSRMREKLDELTVRKQYFEIAALMGIIKVEEVPGLLGLEMQKRKIEAIWVLTQFEQGQAAARKELEEQQSRKESPIITDGQTK
jgi:aminoglycoside phosphotransferase (APT) family kinase protein